MKYQPKPLFIERINKLLKDEKDIKKFFELIETRPKKAIRCNTLKIQPEELKAKLEKYNWDVKQPFLKYPEIMIIESQLEPGELGKTKEHLLGYYYVQEITSMMPIIALNPSSEDIVLDLCAAPGSKTTQAVALMKNKGTIIANDINIGRISVLSSNLEKVGATSVLVTRHNGIELCQKLKKLHMKFDKILVDAPCSGEGNIRTSPRTLLEWSEGLLKRLSKKQKRLISSAFELLKPNGELVYSTCTYAPEENEEVVQYLLDTFGDDVEILSVEIPLKFRSGLIEWRGKKFNKDIKKAVRIYHQDNDAEGFFVCRVRRLG